MTQSSGLTSTVPGGRLDAYPDTERHCPALSRQTSNDCFSRHRLAINHLSSSTGSIPRCSPKLMHVLAAADAERTNVFGELIDFRLSHLNLTPRSWSSQPASKEFRHASGIRIGESTQAGQSSFHSSVRSLAPCTLRNSTRT